MMMAEEEKNCSDEGETEEPRPASMEEAASRKQEVSMG